ncbi:hypothetical protein HK57_00038 [Aspergillus ustus]|uniref:Zn(2)-C6 fungal-type domain-containing protein n=1 Tax=Aspergillus ustus TaxID=40382 RepID=A0A0C1EFN0_ASPUT|nr:hypothetical protein HK57_00038 [Aspergillus ustus]
MAGDGGILEPQFRLACEECHTRKIRCELALGNPSGGSCKACALNQRRCLFSLRSRTGRPRKQPLAASSSPQNPPSMRNRPVGAPLLEPSQLALAASIRPGQAEDIDSLLQQHTGGQSHIWASRENDPAGWNGAAWQQHHPALASSPGPLEDLLQPGINGWDPTNSIHFMIEGSGTGFMSEACISDLTSLDTAIRLGSPDDTGQAPEQGFLDALKLYSGLHNKCKSTSLDLLTEAGQCKVRSIAKLFDDLSQTAFALQAENDTLLSASTPLRSDISETKVIRAALVEAMQVSIAIIQYNFQLHHSAMDDGSEQSCCDKGSSKTCNCLITAGEKQLGIQLSCLELLIQLEFSLVRFRHLVSKAECLHAGHQRPSAPQLLGCHCWASSAPGVDTARSQVSALLKQFRTLWD